MENIVEFIVKDLLDDDEDFGDPRQVCDYRGKAPIDVAHENGHSQTCAILRDPRKAKEDAAIREAAEVRAMANKNLLFAAANRIFYSCGGPSRLTRKPEKAEQAYY